MWNSNQVYSLQLKSYKTNCTMEYPTVKGSARLCFHVYSACHVHFDQLVPSPVSLLWSLSELAFAYCCYVKFPRFFAMADFN